MSIDVAINGAAGRMGRMLTQAIDDEKDLSLVVALERSDSEFLGQDAGLVAGDGAISVPVVTNTDGTGETKPTGRHSSVAFKTVGGAVTK